MAAETRLAVLRQRLSRLLRDPYASRSYAQEGEDLVLRRYFEGRRRGFFVDVGAHHPRRFSNTYLSYRLGWRGINVEPNPELAALFTRERPGDVTLALGVSDAPGTLTYFRFNEPALNSFDATLSRERDGAGGYHIIGTSQVQVVPLSGILTEHLPPGTAIDLLTVDVEGHDLAVLRSNDWTRFRPTVVLAEALGTSLADVAGSDLHTYLAAQGYELFGKTVHTLFYRDAGGG